MMLKIGSWIETHVASGGDAVFCVLWGTGIVKVEGVKFLPPACDKIFSYCK